MSPILNYTTKIEAHKTISEITQILSKAGAIKITIDNDDLQNPIALTFCIRFKTELLAFSLPCKVEGVLRRLKANKKVPACLKNEGQALRVGWRINKVWIEAQLAIVEAELAAISEVFLPYLVLKNGDTLYQHLETNGTTLLLGNNR